MSTSARSALYNVLKFLLLIAGPTAFVLNDLYLRDIYRSAFAALGHCNNPECRAACTEVVATAIVMAILLIFYLISAMGMLRTGPKKGGVIQRAGFYIALAGIIGLAFIICFRGFYEASPKRFLHWFDNDDLELEVHTFTKTGVYRGSTGVLGLLQDSYGIYTMHGNTACMTQLYPPTFTKKELHLVYYPNPDYTCYGYDSFRRENVGVKIWRGMEMLSVYEAADTALLK